MNNTAALRWRAIWSQVCRSLGASFVSSRDVTNLRARFPSRVDMDHIIDRLMAIGFSVADDGFSVFGFPTCIEDPVTGKPTRFEGLD